MSRADDMDGHGLMGHLIGIPSGVTGILIILSLVHSVPIIIMVLNSGLGYLVFLLLDLHVKKVNMLLYFIKQSNYYAPYVINSLHVFIDVIKITNYVSYLTVSLSQFALI